MSFKSQISSVYNTVKDTATVVNKSAVATGEEVVNEILQGGKQWTTLSKKAVNGGVKIVGKQQEIALSAIEEVKEQLQESANRFKKIVNWK